MFGATDGGVQRHSLCPTLIIRINSKQDDYSCSNRSFFGLSLWLRRSSHDGLTDLSYQSVLGGLSGC